MAKTEMQEVLERRDGKTEGAEEYRYARETVSEMMEDGCSYDEIEDFMLSEIGLEMDYIFDLLF